VIFFSDNGPNSFRWNDGMKGRKGTTDEGGVRSAFCIRWTAGGIKPGTTVKEISGAIDLLPTLAKLARVPILSSKPLDGRDLSPVLFGTATQWPDRVILSHNNGNVSVRTQQYRLDNSGALFDMVADPRQTKDIAKEKPDVAESLLKAVTDWRRSVFGNVASADPTAKKGKGKGKGGFVPPDDRAYPVGYVEFPITPLPARDGVPHGTVQRSANAPNCSYFVNWKTKDDSVTWDIDVHTAGTYDVELFYTCPLADAGSTIELSFKNARLTGKVTPGWDPPLLDKQDRVPRKGESFLKEFRVLKLGSVKLDSGRGVLTLKATDIPGKCVMDLRQLNLTLRK
jgi:hypothetical protein